jgi:glycosyltransferase involved in cell wall biosynthesis
MRERVLSVSNLNPEMVAVVPSSLLMDSLALDDVRPHPLGGGAFTFLCLAHYHAHKNLEVLIPAVKRLPELVSEPAQCLITISPDQHPGARKLIKRIEDDHLAHLVFNIGPVPANERSRVYRSADAFILPTLLETFSFTYLEAMHFGLPILTSDRDFAHDRCQDAAVYFDPLNADSVAEAMASVMGSEGLRRQLVGNGARIVAQTPTWDEIATRFVEVLERAAMGKPVNGQADNA